ncbi:putative adhesin [Aquimarina sp. SS2-1]|uniref:putative adhesin n=1 Tax=Aquimarina besae TaxID=3342247 RepID=UPI00366CAC19
MSKVIVLSGHGSWEMGDGYVTLPARYSIKFYTDNMKLLSDTLGGNIDRGNVAGLIPDQEASPYSTIPNMRLYPPDGLMIQAPDQNTWNVVDIPTGIIPRDDKNLQIHVADYYNDGMNLKELFDVLDQALFGQEVTILWAACRDIGLIDAGGESFGVNVLQR